MTDQDDETSGTRGRTVNVTLVDGKLVRLVFDGEDDNPVTIEASAKLEDYPELKELKTAKGKAPRDKRLRALLNCDGGTLQYDDDGATYRINVLKQQEGQQPSTGIGKQQPQLDDTNREMEMVVLHWGKSDVVVRKRKLETETLSRKKPAVEKTIDRAPTNDDEREWAVGKKVEVVHPKEDCHWYLGKQGQPFYVRSCVQDMGSVILDRILDQQKRGPVLYVISGASGIGKSWSINAFATELLRAEKKIFFHSGYDGRAWKINGVGDVEHGVAPGNITALDKEWVYVYDSPGSKETLEQKNTARVRTGPGEVTVIFSSPEAQNYQFAVDKSNGDPRIMNLPTWKKEEMLTVKEKDAEAVDASYGIWGGNMRALDRFIARHTDDRENAKHLALEELDAHIGQIDEVFARKMACKLEKQEVQRQFSGQAVQNSPGHILTPEPTNIDPGESGCFENFRWHFCSPLAEVKFWERLKHMDHGVLKELLISVFKTPSPKGVLFEKVAHVLITNGVVQQFECYPYIAKHQARQIKFQECQTPNPISFETDKLEDELGRALLRLRDKAGAVALEPKDTSFDAVDMFVLEKKEGTTETTEDWSLHMIQDTISKTHSFHPLKVLWYCSVFSKVFKEKFQNAEGDPLMCCKYVPVVPGNEKSFAFKKATSDLTWDELDSVEKLLEDFNWHPEFSSKKPNWQAVVKKESLVIPLNANGKVKQLNRKVVGSALLLKHVTETEKVEQMSEVIFNVVSTCENA